MKLTVIRYSDNDNSTLGLLFLDNKFECYTLEDQYQTKKVYKETRIPAGTYKIKLRKEGSHHLRYNIKFPEFHNGMLELQDVKDFQYILIHIGNTDDDTAGCLIVGNSINNNQITKGFISNSTGAYVNLYKKVVTEAENDNLEIEIVDLDRKLSDSKMLELISP